jgi:hypothetical protein
MAPEIFWMVFSFGFLTGWTIAWGIGFYLWVRDIDRRAKDR